MAENIRQRKIMIVVGEASGDSHAAKLVEALRKLSPDTEFNFFGAAGHNMRNAGVESVVVADELSIMGLPEVAKAFPMFWRAFKKLKAEAVKRKPDVVVLVDFPEFNLKLAKTLKHNGLRVVYYISPQLWAWRKYRAKGIKKYTNLLLAILPFEKQWYAARGIHNVEYVGNPLSGEVTPAISKDDFCLRHDLDSEKPIVALLGGSRRKELSRILPPLIEAASLMELADSNIQFVVALAPTRRIGEVDAIVERLSENGVSIPRSMVTVVDETYEALNAADVAAVASGTATLETAIIGTPLVVVYKTTAFNWHFFRPMISVEHFGLVNLIAQKRLAKELIQYDLTPSEISAELFRLLDIEENKIMRSELDKVRQMLGDGGASIRAARAILRIIN